MYITSVYTLGFSAVAYPSKCPSVCSTIDWFLLTTQVEDVNAKFDALKKLKENNWKEEEKKPKKVTKKSKAKVCSEEDGC